MAVAGLFGRSRMLIFKSIRKSEARTVKGKLRALRRFFVTHRWTRGALVRMVKSEPAFCLQGGMMALGLVEPELMMNYSHDKSPGARTLEDAVLHAAETLGYDTNNGLVHLNDHEIKSRKQLLNLLDRAIELV